MHYNLQQSPANFLEQPQSPSTHTNKAFRNQIRALLVKNYRLQSKYKCTNFCQIITPLFCLYFSFLLTKIWSDSGAKGSIDFPMLHNIPYDVVYNNSLTPIVLTSCLQWYLYDFANASQETKNFVLNKDNPGSDILSNINQFQCHQYDKKVPYFQKPKDEMTINEELADDYRRMNEYPFVIGTDNQIAEIMPDGAITFSEANSKRLSYTVQISDNQLNEYRRMNGVTKFLVNFNNQTYVIARVFDGMLGMIDMMSRRYLQMANQDIFLLSGVMRMPNVEGATFYMQKAISLAGSFLYPVALSLLLPIFLSSLVLEKEEGLRGMMKMNGLKMRNYWLVHYIWNLGIYYIVIAFFWGLGRFHLQFQFFIDTNSAILLATFVGWGHCQIGFAFLLQCFMKKSRTAAIAGYLLGTVLIFLAVCVNTGVYQAPSVLPIWLRSFPSFGFARILYLLAASCGSGHCIQTFGEIKGELLDCFIAVYAGAIVFLLIAMRIEGGKTNIYKSIRSLFNTCFGVPSKEKLSAYKELDVEVLSTNKNLSEIEPEDEDEDCKTVREFAENIHNNMDQYALVSKGLCKIYPSQDDRPPKMAVKNFSLVIPRGELFGLLGPNGAGKTTLISMLTGLTQPTQGAAWVSGSNIMSEMEEANSKMGVCPQDNYLWPDLTVEEHLEFYAKLKGVPKNAEKAHVEKAIRDVALEKFTKFQAKSLSGGMQRRLSVAISLVGDPDIVFLDEPTTGLDPENRRGLWDILANLKGETAMVLTTHSMEEADVLCSRIGIFKDGGLKCIGAQTRLKKLYGDGYYLYINCFRDINSFLVSKQNPEENKQQVEKEELLSPLSPQNPITVKIQDISEIRTLDEEAKDNTMNQTDEMEPYYEKLVNFIKEILPQSELRSCFNGNFCFQIPSEGFKVSSLFRLLNEQKENLMIKDWGVSQSSLEEVFLKIANEEKNMFEIV